MNYKELIFFRDLANWVVWRSPNVADVITHQAEVEQYAEKAYMSSSMGKEWRFVILSPDIPTQIAVKYAIKHDDSLSKDFKERILYEMSDQIKYILMLYEPLKFLLYWGYMDYIRKFNKDKPWIDYKNRNFEYFVNSPKETIARVVAYNSYLKCNKVLKLTYSDRLGYSFKEDAESPSLCMEFDDVSHSSALSHCLEELRLGTCLNPISVTKFFKEDNL